MTRLHFAVARRRQISAFAPFNKGGFDRPVYTEMMNPHLGTFCVIISCFLVWRGLLLSAVFGVISSTSISPVGLEFVFTEALSSLFEQVSVTWSWLPSARVSRSSARKVRVYLVWTQNESPGRFRRRNYPAYRSPLLLTKRSPFPYSLFMGYLSL